LELDQFKDVYLVIDKANDSFVQKQFVSQGDYKGRTLTVQITNNGSVGEVPGLTLNLNWHNEASGLTDLTAFTVLDKTNSVFQIEYPEHMMTPGKVYANIQVIQDGKVTNLQQFELIVQKLAGQPVGIPEKAEFSALVAVLADANKFRTDIDKKADKTYINDYLSKVTIVPETFTNLEAIKAKYPSGKNGLMIAADNGHKYIWNGTSWADAGVYQSAGIADGSINLLKLSGEAIPVRFVPSSNGLPTYDSSKHVLSFAGTTAGNAEYVKVGTSLVRIAPNTVVDCTPKNSYMDGFLQINLSTGVVSYQNYSWKNPDANCAILAMLKHGVVKSGRIVPTIFSGTLADFVLIDGMPQQLINQPIENIKFVQASGVKAVYDPATVTFNFGNYSSQTPARIYYSGGAQTIPSNTVATPVGTALTSFYSVKICWNPTNMTGIVIAWNGSVPNGFFVLGGVNCDRSNNVSSVGLGDVILKGTDTDSADKRTVYKRKETVFNILHYGYHTGVPHESAASYFKTIDKGFDLDTDICWTKDNIPICSHSNSTTSGLLEIIRNADGTSVTDTFDINDKTYDELCQYDWGIYCGDTYKGLNPLKFEDFLKILHANDCYANAEWKTQVTGDQFVIVRDLINKYDCLDRITFESFYDRYYNLTLMQTYIPNATLAINATGNQAASADFIDKLKGISNGYNQVFASLGYGVDPAIVENVLLAGFKVELWVVNDDTTLSAFKDYAISGWFTDGNYDPKNRLQTMIANEIL